MKKIWYVDLPDPCKVGIPGAEWKQIEIFFTKKEAVEFCRDEFGADEEGRVQLISEGEEN